VVPIKGDRITDVGANADSEGARVINSAPPP
jgi:hypothetical protein